MDYKKVYDNLISTRKDRILPDDIYTECHHIIPISLGGKNVHENLINLTPREHFLAHWLLWRIYKPLGGKNARSMAYAFHCMHTYKNRRKINSARGYAEAKEAFIAEVTGEKNPNFGEISEKRKSEIIASNQKRKGGTHRGKYEIQISNADTEIVVFSITDALKFFSSIGIFTKRANVLENSVNGFYLSVKKLERISGFNECKYIKKKKKTLQRL